MPKCRVVESAFTWNHDRHPRTSWEETIILEDACARLHDPASGGHRARRGTFAALASPPVIDYLIELGVTAVELLPIHAVVNDRQLVAARAGQLLGLQHDRVSSRPIRAICRPAPIAEFKTAVKRLHEAGIEVILDVVYNHTGEGNHLGPTLSFRGIDNLSLLPAAARTGASIRTYTGTGNTLNTRSSARAAAGHGLAALLGD